MQLLSSGISFARLQCFGFLLQHSTFFLRGEPVLRADAERDTLRKHNLLQIDVDRGTDIQPERLEGLLRGFL